MNVTLACMNRPWANYPFERALDGIRRAGFTSFALLRHGGKMLIGPDTAPGEAAEVASTIRRHGLELVMIPNFLDLAVSDDEAIAATKRQLDHCARLGVRVLLEMGFARPEGYERYFAVMQQAAPYAGELGVTIAIKPHGGLTKSSAEMLAAVGRVGHPAYRICHDPGNLIAYGDPQWETSLPALVPHVIAMCVKDMVPAPEGAAEVQRGQSNRSIQLVTPGDGMIDYRPIFKTLADHGFSGPVAVETLAAGTTPEAVDESARRAYDYLRSVLPGS